MFVLDTDVVSELRKVEAGKGHRQVAAWSEQVTLGETFLASITIHELELGILLLERKDKRQGAILRAWIDTRVLPEFEARILPVDVAVVRFLILCSHRMAKAALRAGLDPKTTSLAYLFLISSLADSEADRGRCPSVGLLGYHK